MLSNFKAFCKKYKLIDPKQTTLLTVSGGLDSVVMANLFSKAKYPFAIAHCNFELRGKESDGDEAFVEKLAEQFEVPFHSTTFETKAYAVNNGISIQMAARELRYNWFNKLATDHGYKHIATAHHKNDSLETFFINLLRGAGISSLKGIAIQNKNIIRPMMFSTRTEIESFARKSKLKWREDSSNSSEKYIRNKIRLKLIPLIQEINPAAPETIEKEMHMLSKMAGVFENAINDLRKKYTSKTNNSLVIQTTELTKIPFAETVLFELLRPYDYNYTQALAIFKQLDKSGKAFVSKTHRLYTANNKLVIEAKTSNKKTNIKIGSTVSNVSTSEGRLSMSSYSRPSNFLILKETNIAQLDADKITFPLTIRNWKTGDTFTPLGMKGRKKIGDFFTDKKIDLISRKKALVVCSNKEIVWIIGYRINDKFKITRATKNILELKLKN